MASANIFVVAIIILVVAAAFVAVGCIFYIHTNTGFNSTVIEFNYMFQKLHW
jgi:hypothetical protein